MRHLRPWSAAVAPLLAAVIAVSALAGKAKDAYGRAPEAKEATPFVSAEPHLLARRRQLDRAHQAYRRELRRLIRRWACIHRLEGQWDDRSPPYFGGLQFDWSFMRAYGP